MANLQVATLAGGCFWCIESAFNSVDGVEKALSGYAGGEDPAPTYEKVCGGNTGHAEVVQVTFDADKLTYREVLEIFFALHNPTQLNRQGNDVGTQYRSAIFYHDLGQKAEAEKIIAEISNDEIWPDPVVTEVVEINNYHEAESYHQDYFKNNPQNQYCSMVVAPKLAKFKKTFASKLRS
ncbi:MAG: peptide-methionine (S)-S-oxide reductase [Alteromonas sp.]|jgi:peptide-methionine (S)-S-oxide reductase|uniref:peptide-methionine (S)-S-oxide reductase MsrA n=1 Tax=unclassified Alteromonas TaxID=2614992 RepID=UPI00090349DF|nr:MULTISPECIES: peptide-methionine (S)-S-oxide reductase MsrA [unclassified Alteromonas]APE06969.1 peptide-methionine (S)-S-oxide reductase [Alteromonas sp. RW2A1]AUC89558.1 peptide-methionine (S)-S-oxide reductase [Alteromonas sp. MB-3u-76]MAI64797.1 peptide-methionine (S)-S-oxide reductase [Alteromonas sp.]MCP4057808.1 peptide-methionine (S)-S-oxide reductase MsrA [Pseudoalteromonas sp.]